MNNILIAISYAVLGAILAGLAQWSASYFLERSRTKSSRVNYLLVVRAELESVVKQMERLKNSFNERGYYPFALLNSLVSRVARLEQNISNIHNIGKNSEVQNKFITTVTDLSDLNQDLQSIENLKISRQKEFEEKKIEIDKSKAPASEKTIEHKTNSDAITDTDAFIGQQRTARLVELVDIKRRAEELIETFRK